MNRTPKTKAFSVTEARHIARRYEQDFPKTETGAERLVALAEAGQQERACVVIGESTKFCSSQNGYKNTVVLVNEGKFSIPAQAKRFGTQLSRLSNNPFVLLTHKAAAHFLGQK